MINPLILALPLSAIAAGLVTAVVKRRRVRNSAPDSSEGVLLVIKVPKGSEKTPLAAEQMFAALHGLLRLTPEVQEHLTFEISGARDGIFFYCWTPKHLRSFAEGQIYAQYPDAEVREVDDYTHGETTTPASKGELFFAGADLVLARENFFPIKTFPDFDVDPLAAMTGSLADAAEGEQIWVQLLIRPISDGWQEAGHRYVDDVRKGLSREGISPAKVLKDTLGEFGEIALNVGRSLLSPPDPSAVDRYRPPPIRLSDGQEFALKMIESKLSRMGFEAGIRLLAFGPTEEAAVGRLRAATASFRQFSSSQLNAFESGEVRQNDLSLWQSFRRRVFPDSPYVLTTEELASIFHLPNVSVETPAIAWSLYKKGEPPLNLPTSDCTLFAQTTFRDRMVKFGIKRDDRRRHFYAVGKTGCGKSTMFENMALQDMENGEGLAVLDPLGDTVEHLLERVPDHRVEDVVIFDPSDFDHPVALNLLECPDPSQKNLMASGLVDAIKKHFDYSWGPRLEYLLNNAILTLLEVPRTTLLGITRLLSDVNYQKYIVHKINDPLLRDFWEREYKDMRGNQRLITEAVAPIQNKIGRFLASTTIRNILGQARSTIKMDEIMDEGKILFVNLSKGKIGADNANLLGSLLISRLNFMAMQRARVPEAQRRDFYLYVDEFQNFASGSFASILSEARKYRLCLHLTHQYIAQLPEEMGDAVFGNVGTTIAFGVGGADATKLAVEFAPVFTEEDLISLENYHIYVKLMIDRMTSRPFSAMTIPPMGEKTGNRDKVIARSREKYGADAAEVTAKIGRWMERDFNLGLAKAEGAGAKKGPTEAKSSRQVKGEVVLKPKDE